MAWILPHPATSWTSLSAAGVIVIVTLIAALLVGRAMRLAEHRLADRPGGLDAPGHTRLRFLSRLFSAAILLTGLFLALLEFDSFGRLAGAAIASGALFSAIIGFAARDTLANAIAGVSIALTQPIRVGDLIQVGDARGVVEDVTLTATWLRTAEQTRVIVPNALVTSTAVRNDSVRDEAVLPAAMIWLEPGADTTAALAALRATPGVREASIEEVTFDGVRLRALGAPVHAGERAKAEAELRAGALARLRATGVQGAAGQ